MPLGQNAQADFRRGMKIVGTKVESPPADIAFNTLIKNALPHRSVGEINLKRAATPSPQ
jgi:hypothetical protein